MKGRRLRIGLIAPLDRTIPPRGHAGTERIVAALAEGLVKRGHLVTLFASGDSRTPATLVPSWPKQLKGESPVMRELATTKQLLDVVGTTKRIDVWSNHLYYGAMALAPALRAPLLTTIHGAHSATKERTYATASKYSRFVSISQSQRRQFGNVRFAGTVYNGIDMERFTLGRGEDGYFAWIGWISEKKGTAEAIQLARRHRLHLKIAGLVTEENREYFEKQVRPFLSSRIEFLGEIDGRRKVDFYRNAVALLNPIKWEEPFGLVVAEAMACGTPVLAVSRGAMPELITDGVSGFLAPTPSALGRYVERVSGLGRTAVRADVVERFSDERMVDDYERLFRRVAAKTR